MTISFAPAVREQVRARYAIAGLSGAGKTVTALRMMKRLCGDQPFAMLDTQNGQSKHYVGRFEDLQFDIVTPREFTLASLTETIGAAEAQGYAGLVVDSGSSFWSGKGGVLEYVDGHRNKFDAWKEITPKYNEMIAAFQHCGMHFGMTLRVKAEYVVEQRQNAQGRESASPRKVGMKPDAREGLDYEFDLAATMDQSHTLTIDKSVVEAIPVGSEWVTPGPDLGGLLADHCASGVQVEGPRQLAERAVATTDLDALRAIRDDVIARGLDGAPTQAPDGAPCTLMELVNGLAKRLIADRERAAAIAKAAQDEVQRKATADEARSVVGPPANSHAAVREYAGD